MSTTRIGAGAPFPELIAHSADAGQRNLARPDGDHDWMMIAVYRGKHCPMCTKFLNRLGPLQSRLSDIGIDLAAVSADSLEQLQAHQEKLDVQLPMYYGVDVEALRRLGVYISTPRSPQETDHNFPEPALFVINAEGNVQVADFSNNPFARPEPEVLVGGLEFIRDKDYPIRGTG